MARDSLAYVDNLVSRKQRSTTRKLAEELSTIRRHLEIVAEYAGHLSITIDAR
jgi:hypothetical protein